MISDRLVSIDGRHAIECRCESPCATFESHILRVGGDIYLSTHASEEPPTLGGFTLGEASVPRPDSGARRVGPRSAVFDVADDMFPALEARFGGKAGEVLCAALAWFAIAYLVWNIAGAIARGLSGH